MAQAYSATEPHRPPARPETETESCPWCGQPITHEEFRQIEARIKAEERRKRAQFEEEVRQQFQHRETLRVAKAEAEMKRLTEEAAAAVEEANRQVTEREATARAEAKKAAEDEMKEKLLAARQEKVAAEEAKAAAEREKLEALSQEREKSSQKLKQLEDQVGQLEKEKDAAAAAIEEEKKKAQEREEVIRAEAKAAAIGEAKSEQEEVRRHHVEEMQKQREALEKDKEASLNQEKAKAFADRQKLETKIEELKRQVQRQTATELGEGAEVDLYETLREEFKDDRLDRIDKGEPGADIRHDVMYQGECCGRILYDSKNRKAWRNEYVEKLRGDQLAAEAEHALLTTSVFPAGERQVCIRDGVIIANPARAVALVKIVRDHVVQAHRLRLSGQDRESKTGQLYEFINSDRCEQLLRRSEDVATQLLELDVKEQQAHDRVWQRRGTLIRTAEKANREFRSELDRILGS